MDHPLVSIVIPAYNHEKYINDTLNSVIDDTYPNKEIVIINDGSKDNSAAVIENWILQHKETSVIFQNRENKGICATLNEGIVLAGGKYIVLLASDDMLYGNTIAKRVELLEQAEPDGKLVLVSDALVIDDANNIIKQSSLAEHNGGNKREYATDDGILKEVLFNPAISGATVLINKSIYNIIGYYPDNLKLEDWYFYQRAAAIKAILFWDAPVSLYRLHDTNISRANNTYDIRVALYKSMLKTYYLNISIMPGLKFKAYALMRVMRYIKAVNFLRLKKLTGLK